MLASTNWRSAGSFKLNQARRLLDQAKTDMGRTLDTSDLPDLLLNNLESSRWEKTGDRCLSCTNCTMVCPTCFCTTVEEVTDLSRSVNGEVHASTFDRPADDPPILSLDGGRSATDVVEATERGVGM